MDLRVKGPVGNVEPLHNVGEGRMFELVRREPAAGVPLADGIAHLVLADFHRQQTFRPKSVLDLLIRHERGGTAKIAALADARGVKNRNGLAALAFDGGFFRLPAALRRRAGRGARPPGRAPRSLPCLRRPVPPGRATWCRRRGRRAISWRDSIAPRRRRTGRRIFSARWPFDIGGWSDMRRLVRISKIRPRRRG